MERAKSNNQRYENEKKGKKINKAYHVNENASIFDEDTKYEDPNDNEFFFY